MSHVTLGSARPEAVKQRLQLTGGARWSGIQASHGSYLPGLAHPLQDTHTRIHTRTHTEVLCFPFSCFLMHTHTRAHTHTHTHTHLHLVEQCCDVGSGQAHAQQAVDVGGGQVQAAAGQVGVDCGGRAGGRGEQGVAGGRLLL